MSADDQIEELKKLIEEERQQTLARRNAYRRERYARQGHSKKEKETRREWHKVRNEQRKAMRALGGEAKRKLNDEQNTYLQRRREKRAGKPRPLLCDVCNAGDKLIVLDHCHATNKFRGWLCHSCNLILGHANDDPNLLEKLAVYLRVASNANK